MPAESTARSTALVAGLGGPRGAAATADLLLARWSVAPKGTDFGDLEPLISARAAALVVPGTTRTRSGLRKVAEAWLHRRARLVAERSAFVAVADGAVALGPPARAALNAIRHRLGEIWDEEAARRRALPGAVGEGDAPAYERLAGRLASAPPEDALDVALSLVAEHPDLAGQLAEVRTMLRLAMARGDATEAGAAVRVVTDELARERQVVVGARARILGLETLGPREVAVRLGAKPTNREKVRLLRNESRLLGVPAGAHRWRYPRFQIDADRARLWPVVERVNRLLDAAGDPWGVASWWAGRNVLLDARPCDVVGTDREDDVWRAACALVEHDPDAASVAG